MLVLPKWVIFQNKFHQTIDALPVGSRIAPSMYPKLALMRPRRLKPISFEKVGLFFG